MRCSSDERLGHVDLHVVDVVAVPDRLEQAVGEAEGEDVLRRLLAEEVVDAEDLLSSNISCSAALSAPGAGQVGAERLLHDDPATARRGRPRRASAPRRERGVRRDAEVVQPAGVAAELVLGLASPRRRSAVGARRPSARSAASRRTPPTRSGVTARLANSSHAASAKLRKPSSSRSSSEVPTIRQSGSSPARCRCSRPGQQLALGEVAGRAEQHDHVRLERRHQAGGDVARVVGHAHTDTVGTLG